MTHDDSSHESKDSKGCAYHWIMCHGSRALQRCPNAHLQSLWIDVQECGLTALKCWLLTSLFLIGIAIILGLTNPHPFWDFTKAVATIFSQAQRAGRSQLSGACGENTPSKNVVWNWINIYICVCVLFGGSKSSIWGGIEYQGDGIKESYFGMQARWGPAVEKVYPLAT